MSQHRMLSEVRQSSGIVLFNHQKKTASYTLAVCIEEQIRSKRSAMKHSVCSKPLDLSAPDLLRLPLLAFQSKSKDASLAMYYA